MNHFLVYVLSESTTWRAFEGCLSRLVLCFAGRGRQKHAADSGGALRKYSVGRGLADSWDALVISLEERRLVARDRSRAAEFKELRPADHWTTKKILDQSETHGKRLGEWNTFRNIRVAVHVSRVDVDWCWSLKEAVKAGCCAHDGTGTNDLQIRTCRESSRQC